MVKKLERFLLREILSDGPAGAVYKAEEILPGDNRRTVALKLLPQIQHDSPREERFFGEVRVLAQLAVHPHIVTIYAMGLSDGIPWLAMEYAGASLDQKILDTPADPQEVVKLLEQVGRGLAAMHVLKPPLVHQDLKPANVLLDFLGNYKISDFSMATVTAANRTQGLATVRYAAPELLSGEFGNVGPATDLYALGHIAYEFAVGRRALPQQFPAVYEGNAGKEPAPSKWMMWHASTGIRVNPADKVARDFPPQIAAIIARLMAKPLSERYGSAAELLSDLVRLRQAPVMAPAAAPQVVHPQSRAAGGSSAGAIRMAPPATPAIDNSIDLVPLEGPASAAPIAPAASIAVTPQPNPSAGSAAGAPGGGPKYFVRLRGKVSGPFDLATLQRQVKQGGISRFHQLSADQVTWRQATEIEGLYGPTVVG